MRLALQQANYAAERGEVPIGAVVVVNGKVIARSHNMTETLTDPTAHAEMQAITMATDAFGGKYLTDATIYVTVEPCQCVPPLLDGRSWEGLSMGRRTQREVIRSILQICCTPRQR